MSKGCLSGYIKRIGDGLTGYVLRLTEESASEGLTGYVERIGTGLSGEVYRLMSSKEGLTGTVTRLGVGLSGYVSLVCTVNGNTSYWMWDAGEILYWDNLEYILLD